MGGGWVGGGECVSGLTAAVAVAVRTPSLRQPRVAASCCARCYGLDGGTKSCCKSFRERCTGSLVTSRPWVRSLGLNAEELCRESRSSPVTIPPRPLSTPSVCVEAESGRPPMYCCLPEQRHAFVRCVPVLGLGWGGADDTQLSGPPLSYLFSHLPPRPGPPPDHARTVFPRWRVAHAGHPGVHGGCALGLAPPWPRGTAVFVAFCATVCLLEGWLRAWLPNRPSGGPTHRAPRPFLSVFPRRGPSSFWGACHLR